MNKDNTEKQEDVQEIYFDKVKVLFNKKTEEIYVSKCYECSKLLTADEASYGHDCE